MPHHRATVLFRVALVGIATFTVALLALWATGHFPPVALANSGGGVTYRTLTKCTPTGGTILNSPSGTTFVNNTVVTLTADPNPGYDFSAWTGSVTGSTNPINLTMNANKSVCATFVVDNTIPVITLTGSATVYVECGDPYTDAGATATDNRDGNITSRIVVGGDAVDVDTPGTYVITYNVQDDAENAATQVTRTVIVEDTGIPVITLVGASVVYLDLNATYTEAGATALDDCEGALSGVTIDSTDVNTSAYGAYVVTYNTSDSASNAAVEVTREVRVWPKLEIGISGAGSTLPPAGQAHYYAPGTVVDIEAVDNWGGGFITWSGGPVADPLSAETTITLNSAQNITAAFGEAEFYPVTLAVEGEGTLHYAASGGVPGTVTEAGGPVVVPLNPEDNLLWLESIPVTEETEFWQWLSEDPAIDQTYIAEGDFTIEGPTQITAVFVEDGVLDFVLATLVVRGGEGETIPSAGTHRIPKYAGTDLDCITACQDNSTLPSGCGPCEYAPFHVTAVSTEDAFFRQWNSVGLPGPVTASSASVPMIGTSAEIIATFADRPGLGNLDLLADLGEFLVEVGVYTDPEEVYNLDVDYGGVSVEGGVVYYDGNDVPDAAEFYLLDALMKDIARNLTPSGGIASGHAWRAFYANQQEAATDLPTASDAAVNVIAAYMTLGSNGHVGQAKAWALAEYAVTLDARDFDRLGGERLLPKKDADADGRRNALEWELTPLEGTPGPEANAARLAAYYENALDPELPEELAGEGEGEGKQTSGQNKSEGEEEEDCLDALPKVEVTVIGGTVTPAAEVPIGTEVTISASGDHFLRWSAPGCMADGSGSASETFIVTGDVTATAIYDTQFSMMLFENNIQVGSMEVWSMEPASMSGGGMWKGNWQYGSVGGTHASYQGGVTVLPSFAGAMNKLTGTPFNYCPFGSLTFTAPSSEGGYVCMGHTYFQDPEPMFLESVTVPKCSVLTGCSFAWALEVLGVPLPGYFTYGFPSPLPYAFESFPIEGEFRNKGTLELTVEVDGGGADDPACAGYVTADVAKKYYDGGEVVTLAAQPHCGYRFDMWFAEGEKGWAEEDDIGNEELARELVTLADDSEVFVKFDASEPEKKEIQAVFRKLKEPESVSGFMVPGSGTVGGEYGARARLIFENAGGWAVKEIVSWSGPEGAGFSDCTSRGEISQPPDFMLMNRCDLDGTPNPTGEHAFIEDWVRNLNGPPWMVVDRLQNKGEALPCASTTVQLILLSPSLNCTSTLTYDYEFEQRVTVNVNGTDNDNGTVEAYHEVAGSVTLPWTRLW